MDLRVNVAKASTYLYREQQMIANLVRIFIVNNIYIYIYLYYLLLFNVMIANIIILQFIIKSLRHFYMPKKSHYMRKYFFNKIIRFYIVFIILLTV